MPYNRNIFDYLPAEYEEYIESREILTAEQIEFAGLDASIDDLLQQFRVSTATWGLVEWEKLIGVKNPENYLYSSFRTIELDQATFEEIEGVTWASLEVKFPRNMEERRSDIKAKLRGQGTVTKQHVLDVVKSYANGDVDIVEKHNDYTLLIRFVNKDAMPYDLDRVKEVIREITPAHLELEFTIAYLLINEIDNVKTLADMEQLTLERFAGGETING